MAHVRGAEYGAVRCDGGIGGCHARGIVVHGSRSSATSKAIQLRLRLLTSFAAILAALLTAGMTPASAHAQADPGWWDSHTAYERRAITNAFYEATGHAPPFSDAQGYGHEIAEHVEASGQDAASPGTALVAGGQVRTASKLGLLPPMKTLAPQLFKIGGGALAVTMIVQSEIELGQYIYARLLVDDTVPTSIDYNYVRYYAPGYDLYYGATTNDDQWLFLNGDGPVRWFEPPCAFSGFLPPTGASLRSGVPTDGAKCAYLTDEPPYYHEAPIFVDYPFLTEDDIGASTTVTTGPPIGGQYDAGVSGWDPTAPLVADIWGLLGAALEADGLEALRAQLEWELGEDGQDPSTEPIKVGVTPQTQQPEEPDEDQWCERTPPGTTDTFVPEVNPFTLMTTYPTSEGFSAPMRAGSVLFGSGGYIRRNIKGFGLRKIIAKHGWLPMDRADTAAALAAPWRTIDYASEQPNTKPARWGRVTFYGAPYPLPSGSGAPAGAPGACQRVVVVDTLPRQDQGEPSDRGIITSFGKYDATMVIP